MPMTKQTYTVKAKQSKSEVWLQASGDGAGAARRRHRRPYPAVAAVGRAPKYPPSALWPPSVTGVRGNQRNAADVSNSVQGAFHDKLTDLTVRAAQAEKLEQAQSPLISLTKSSTSLGDGKAPST